MAQLSPQTESKLSFAYRTSVRIIALGVLVNALIAGRTLIGEWDIVVHGIIGNGLFVVALLALALAVITRAGRSTIVVAAALVVLIFAQIGLGYTGRDTANAFAWHVPNGVAIFGLAVWAAAKSAPTRPSSH